MDLIDIAVQYRHRSDRFSREALACLDRADFDGAAMFEREAVAASRLADTAAQILREQQCVTN